MRLLAIDPGDARIGIALSDAMGLISRPFAIIKHVSRQKDAIEITKIAKQNKVELIIIGNALDGENLPTLQSRKAKRLAAAVRDASGIRVSMWDESGSSQKAIEILRTMNISRQKNREIDDIAASLILQNYIDSQSDS